MAPRSKRNGISALRQRFIICSEGLTFIDVEQPGERNASPRLFVYSATRKVSAITGRRAPKPSAASLG